MPKTILPKVKLFFLVSLIALSLQFSISISPAEAVTQDDIDKVQRELQELQRKINEINNKQKGITNTITQEDQRQDILEADQKKLDEMIIFQQNQVSNQQLEVDKNKLSQEAAQKEQKLARDELTNIEADIKQTNTSLNESLNLLLKMHTTAPSFFDKTTKYEDSIINEEKQEFLSTMVRKDLENLKSLKQQAVAKEAKITEKVAELKKLQEESVAKVALLNTQKEALTWQKNNKVAMLDESKRKQIELERQNAALENDEHKLENQAHNAQAALENLINQLTKRPPPSGAGYVQAGQVIGFQGRTGLVCGYPAAGIKRTNNYCGQYAYAPSLYYHDARLYPSKGSHLHFQYTDRNRSTSRTLDYLKYDNKEFAFKPYSGTFAVSQGYHQGNAVDLTQRHGSPVYAVKSGKITYYCNTTWPFKGFPDPAFGAIMNHDDGTISVYWHMQRPANPNCVQA